MESGIRKSVDQFFAAIARTLEAIRCTSDGAFPLVRALTWSLAPPLYLLVSSGGDSHGAIVALNAQRAAWSAPEPTAAACQQIRDQIAGRYSLPDVDRLLIEARTNMEIGELEFAFLQTVIAAELETGRTIRQVAERRGVSKNKLDDFQDDMGYSWCLNVGLPLVLDTASRPSNDLIGSMNAARKLRNKLMHEATFSMDRAMVGVLINQTRDYINALRQRPSGLEATTVTGPEILSPLGNTPTMRSNP